MNNAFGLHHLWTQGDFVTHFVALFLLFLSVVTWVILISRIWGLRNIKRLKNELDGFWRARSLEEGLASLSNHALNPFYKVAKKEGHENTSIAKIAVELDINPTLVIHYFKTKESLIYALIDYILERYLLIYTIKQKEQAILADLHKTIAMLFSNKWNSLFDDGLFYTFYAKNI